MGVQTIKIYTCDGCGIKSENHVFRTDFESGHLEMSFIRSRGSVGFDGAWGGTTDKKNALYCFRCADKIVAFLKTLKGGVE